MNQRTLAVLFILGRPFSPFYSLGMALRYRAYRRGIFKVRKVGSPVISIGNLCLGGTGKTPHVIEVARWLLERGLRPAVVTRGYGGRAGTGPLVVSDGQNVMCDAAVSGDEPYMMAQALRGVPVIAGSNRVRCAKQAVSSLGARTILLDDGFQHIRLHRDIDIVLLPAGSPLGTGRIFPSGNLRESPTALKRASCILVSKCETTCFNRMELVRHEIRPFTGNVPVFYSHTKFMGIRIAENDRLISRPFPASATCFCGIADPDSFVHLVRSQGIKILGRDFFPDHYPIGQEELSRILENARKTGCEMVLTTEKDFARIKSLWERKFRPRRNIPALGIVEIASMPGKGFWQFLKTRLDNILNRL